MTVARSDSETTAEPGGRVVLAAPGVRRDLAMTALRSMSSP
jgi:hypothetical protein